VSAFLGATATRASADDITGDFDGDGVPDVAKIDDDSTISIQLRRESTYEDMPPILLGTSPKAIVAADFNGDGILDLAIANGSSNSVSLLLGNGDGTFKDELRFPTGQSGLDALFLGDFNGDGHPDLASVAFDTTEVFVLLGNDGGSFQSMVVNLAGILTSSSALLIAGSDTPPRGGADQANGAQIPTADGPDPALSEPLPSLTAVAAGEHSDDDLGVRASAEEPKELFSSLDVPVSLLQGEGQRPPLADVLVINGPGFTSDVKVLYQPQESQGHQELLSNPSNIAPPGTRSTPMKVVPSGEAPVDEPALKSFRLVLDDILRATHLNPQPGKTGKSSETVQPDPSPLGNLNKRQREATPPSLPIEPLLDSVHPTNSANEPSESLLLALLSIPCLRDQLPGPARAAQKRTARAPAFLVWRI
jgi:hypothetical protein